MILVSKFIVPRGYVGITIFPFVFLKYSALKANSTVLNHEKIHLRQQLEMLVVPFFVFYGFEFLYKLMRYKNWYEAYRNLSFEREAYRNEKDLNYLKSRPFWAFLKYLRK